MILAITGTCNDPGLQIILYIVKKFMLIVQIIGPILCICSIVYTFTMLVTNPEDKKLFARIKNSAIALAVLFLLPFVINLTIQTLGEGTNFSNCWRDASKPSTKTPSYKSVNNTTATDAKKDNTSSDSNSKSSDKKTTSNSKKTVDTSDKSKVYNRPGSGVW